jgi:hypothetical protein
MLIENNKYGRINRMKIQELAADPLNVICEYIHDKKEINSFVFLNSQISSTYAQTPIFITNEMCKYLMKDSMEIKNITTTNNLEDVDWLDLTGREVLRRVYQITLTLKDINTKVLNESIIEQYQSKVAIDSRVPLLTAVPTMLLNVMKYFKMHLSQINFPPPLEPFEIKNLRELRGVICSFSIVPEKLLQQNQIYLNTVYLAPNQTFVDLLDELNRHSIIALGTVAYRYAVLLNPLLMKKAVSVGFDTRNLSYDEIYRILFQYPELFQYYMEDEFYNEEERLLALQLTIQVLSSNPLVYQYMFQRYKEDPKIITMIPDLLSQYSPIVNDLPDYQRTKEIEMIAVQYIIPSFALKNIESMIKLVTIHLQYNTDKNTFKMIEYACKFGIQSNHPRLKSMFTEKGFSWNFGRKIKKNKRRKTFHENYIF